MSDELTEELTQTLREESARAREDRIEDAANVLALELRRERQRRTEMTDAYITERQANAQRREHYQEQKLRLEFQKELTRQLVIALMTDADLAYEIVVELTGSWGGPWASTEGQR